MKSIEDYAREWTQNSEADAMGVVLTDTQKLGRWNNEEFYRCGEEEISRVFAYMQKNDIQQPRHEGSFLDFGCGLGRNSKALRARMASGVGIDISPIMIERASQAVPDVTFLLNQGPDLGILSDQKFDLVYCHVVLQHMRREFQIGYIREFGRVLQPGGIAILQVPDRIVGWKGNLVQRGKKLLPTWLRPLAKKLVGRSEVLGREIVIEMHPLPRNMMEDVIRVAGFELLKFAYTNSVEPDHNGDIIFMENERDALAHFIKANERLADTGEATDMLSCTYFLRKRQAVNGSI